MKDCGVNRVKMKARTLFLWLDVNVLVFYRFSKSFYTDVVLGAAATVHADIHFRVLRAGSSLQ